MPATPEAPSSSTIGQLRTSSRQSVFSFGQARGVMARKANTQRQNDSAIGGTVPAMARPTTELPAHASTARASSRGANPQRRPSGPGSVFMIGRLADEFVFSDREDKGPAALPGVVSR